MTTKKHIALSMSALVLMLIITMAGCMPTDTDTPFPSESPSSVPTTQTPSQTPDAPTDMPATSPAESPTAVPTDTQPTQTPGELHAEGEYVGRIDNSSIEVIVGGTPAAYRLTETTAMQVLALTEGQTIGFTYTTSDTGQYTIVRFDDTPQTLIAEFAGQIDPHSIEVTTDEGDAVVFQLSGDALTQASSFEPGDTIVITFAMNASGQLVANTLALQ